MGTNVAQTGAVDDGTAQGVAPLLEGETTGHAIVRHHAAVALEQEHLLTIEPPHGCAIGTCCQTHVGDVLGAVDVCFTPEEVAIELAAIFLGEAEEFHVVACALQRVPLGLALGKLRQLVGKGLAQP